MRGRVGLPRRICFVAGLLFFVVLVLGAKAPINRPLSGKSRLAPLPAGEKPVASHAPYDAGDCSLCHQSGDVQNPGPVKMAVNELCLGCHEDYKEALARKYGHAAVKESCVNCHNPHGANVEHLLIQLPMQLCLQCHGTDNVLDHAGKKLTNMKKLLADNPKHHGPVAAEDCSACHNPHGSQNFRLLSIEYPATFYSPYDSSLYGLCFNCHEEKAFTTPETDELTQFRNDTENLHYVHVNKSENGRTCRACHDVHACSQEHNIRDGVPFGPKGWTLKLHYTKTATGGSCEKTCHRTQTYNNSTTAAAADPDGEQE